MAYLDQVVSRHVLESSNQSSKASSPDLNVAKSILKAYFGDQQNINVLEQDIKLTTAGGGASLEVPEEEMEFRMFSHGPGKFAKIKLDETDFSTLPLGFVVPDRPQSFYFWDKPSRQTKQQIKDSTLTDDQVMKLSESPWPGMAMVWRVLTVEKQSSRQMRQLELHAQSREGQADKKARPNKNVRIARRKAQRLDLQKADLAKKQADEKEVALRNKKIRRNREKKLKKKEKERAKKSVANVDCLPGSVLDASLEQV